MNTKEKRLGTKAQIRAIKNRERRIATAIFLVFILLIVVFSSYFTYNYINQQVQTICPAFMFKAAIVDHLSLSFPNQTFVETATNILKQASYSVDYYSSEQVTVEFYRSFFTRGYGLIILRIHSAPYENAKEIFFFTAQPYSKTQYVHEQLTDQARMATPQMTALQVFSGNFPVYFAIGPKFIQQTPNTKLGNTTIIAMGCDALKYASMAEAFVEKGAKVYISWNGPVSASHTDQATTCLLQHLITEKQAIEQAVENTMKDVGPDPTYKSVLLYYPSKAGEQTIENIKR